MAAEKETEISSAFKRAAELRDKPTRHALVAGRKDGIRRLVEVLWDAHPENLPYKRCIRPFSAVEAARVRNTHPTYYVDKSKKPPVNAVSVPATCHDLWIHEDRLELV